MDTANTQPRRLSNLLISLLVSTGTTLLAGINLFVFIGSQVETGGKGKALFVSFLVLATAQTLLGGVALVVALASMFDTKATWATRSASAFVLLWGALLSLGGALGGLLGAMAQSGALNFPLGGAWGRPLRVRGKQLHPELREGSDWTEGERPDTRDLDPATRRALEALWLHDAQKEHASVPAFARVAWILAAAGAPPALVDGALRASLEESEHTKLCFALAAGYGGTSHTVEPMPELLVSGLDVEGDAFVLLARESLEDGCLLEDFNADVAARCAESCEEPVTKRGLERIAREERSHAELSWSIVRWVLDTRGAKVASHIETTIAKLDRVKRPTAWSSTVARLVAEASAEALARHGRLPDDVWAALWSARLAETKRSARALLVGEDRREVSVRSVAA